MASITGGNLITIIFHIAKSQDWQVALNTGFYQVDSLVTEGFIHASTSVQVPKVANFIFRGQPNLVLLCIDTGALGDVPLKWEPPVHPTEADELPPTDDAELFPHIYGVIPVSAVVRVVDFLEGVDGFTFPESAMDLI